VSMCEDCGAPTVTRKGKFGPFVGCTKFPACKWSRAAKPGEKPTHARVGDAEEEAAPNLGPVTEDLYDRMERVRRQIARENAAGLPSALDTIEPGRFAARAPAAMRRVEVVARRAASTERLLRGVEKNGRTG
jgi:hypothetical protein